jgi:tellurite resistance protein TerC
MITQEVSSIGSLPLWIGFITLVIALLALDLGFFHRKARAVAWREAAGWCVTWVTLAGLFNLGIFLWKGPEPAIEFLTGYLIELSLSVDNVFIFIVIFSYFAVPPSHQYRVLFYGILGALIMRGLFVYVGSEILHRFHWVSYLLGLLLAASGTKLLFNRAESVDPSKNFAVRIFKRFFPVSNSYRGEKFFVSENGRLIATPLFLVLLSVEVTDLIFAVDSVPAIFAITTDPFIVFTSNIFAILGLRSMYFLLAGTLVKLPYLNIGLAFVLIFVGVKMLLANVYEISPLATLAIIVFFIITSVLASLRAAPAQPPPELKQDVD